MVEKVQEQLFTDVGKKLKEVVIIAFIIEAVIALVGCLVGAIALLVAAIGVEAALGLVMLPAAIVGFLLGSFLSIGALLIVSWFVYGFCEIVDDVVSKRETPASSAPEKEPAPSKEAVAPKKAPAPTKAPAPVKKVAPPPQIDGTPYLGKKWCSGCGKLLERDATVCSCGCKYLRVIDESNVQQIAPNIAGVQPKMLATHCHICECELTDCETMGIKMCPSCGRTFE